MFYKHREKRITQSEIGIMKYTWGNEWPQEEMTFNKKKPGRQ